MEKDEIGVDFLGPQAPEEVGSSPSARPFLSFSILPGFKCFFKQSVIRENISLQDCYQRVMKDHFFLQKTRKPTAQLFSLTAMAMGEKQRELYFRSLPSEKFYIQSGENPKYRRFSLGKDKQEQLSHLQRQLELYRRSGEEALTKKKKELKNLRQEQQLMRLREEEEKNRRRAVLDRLKVDDGKNIPSSQN